MKPTPCIIGSRLAPRPHKAIPRTGLPRRFGPIACALACLLPVHHSLADAGQHAYPNALTEAARAFREGASTNRYNEAKALQTQLPETRIINVTHSGTSSNLAGRGSRFIVRDYDNPTFILTRQDVTDLLGPATYTNSLSWTYPVASGGSNTLNTFLTIQFHLDHVVWSTLSSTSGSWSSGK